MQDLQFSHEQYDQIMTILSPLYTFNRAQQ